MVVEALRCRAARSCARARPFGSETTRRQIAAGPGRVPVVCAEFARIVLLPVGCPAADVRAADEKTPIRFARGTGTVQPAFVSETTTGPAGSAICLRSARWNHREGARDRSATAPVKRRAPSRTARRTAGESARTAGNGHVERETSFAARERHHDRKFGRTEVEPVDRDDDGRALASLFVATYRIEVDLPDLAAPGRPVTGHRSARSANRRRSRLRTGRLPFGSLPMLRGRP